MRPNFLVFVASLLAAALAGCGSSPPVRFYALSSATAGDPVATQANYTVAVGPVTVPELVDRPNFVTQVDANRVVIQEQVRWADPVDSGVGRALGGNLAQLLQGARVAVYPQHATVGADYLVSVDVQRFESVPGKMVALDVLWSVRNQKNSVHKSGRSLVSEPVTGGDYDALVLAHDRALVTVSRDIAQALSRIATGS